jgi:hypothetical protein
MIKLIKTFFKKPEIEENFDEISIEKNIIDGKIFITWWINGVATDSLNIYSDELTGIKGFNRNPIKNFSGDSVFCFGYDKLRIQYGDFVKIFNIKKIHQTDSVKHILEEVKRRIKTVRKWRQEIKKNNPKDFASTKI